MQMDRDEMGQIGKEPNRGQRKVSFILGTRPEAIKLCPLILAMKEDEAFEPHVCVTGWRHRRKEVETGERPATKNPKESGSRR